MTQIQPLNTGLAIVIGVNKYTNGIPSLKNAVNDAKKVAEMLQSKYNYQVVLLLDEAATLSRIKELLAAIKQQKIFLNNQSLKIEENDRIFFYFAGHGIAFDGLESSQGPQGFLVPQDGKFREEEKEKSLLPMTELHDALIALPCRHLLVVLDCCFAGSFRWAGLNRNAARSQKLYREKYERFTNSKAQQVITSAAYDEKALDSIYRLGKRGEIDGHSPFAEVLLKGLEGEADYSKDGAITANELYLYLQTELDKQKVTQTPGICYLKNHEKGEYIFPVPGFNPNNLDNAPPLSDDNNPYRGLASFDEINQGLFFGRQQVIKDLYCAFNDKKKLGFTAVLGASGTGKSSLVKAGLLPRLREDRWYIVNPFRPGKSPFSAVAAAILLTVLIGEVNLVKTQFFKSFNETNYGSDLAWKCFKDIANIFANILEEYNDQKIIEDLSDVLQKTPKWLTKVSKKLLLVIDQFEELVTDCPEAEKDKFLGWLEEVLRDNSWKVRVIITLRSDFKAQFTSELFDEKEWGVLEFTVPMMTQDEYREVIEKPAAEKVLYFEPRELVDELINEVVQMPGALPLLSFTLSQLYFRCCDRWLMGEKSRAMTREDYQKLGGVMGALKRTATDVFEKLIKEKKATEQTIRDAMLRMVAVSGDELARRRVPMWELVYPEPKNGEVKEVLNAFTTARLLVEGATSDGEEYVEPAHDALVTGWDKILKWKNQQQESLLLQRRLTPAAMEWKEKQEGRFLWNADPYLDVLKKVLKSDDNWFNEVEEEFVGKSTIKRRRNVCLLWGSAWAVTIGLMGFSGFIFIQGLNGKIQGMNARSQELFDSHNELDALVESLKAARQLKWVFGKWSWGISRNTEIKTITTLHQIVYGIKERNRLEKHKYSVNSVAFSPDGKILASASSYGTIILWYLDRNETEILGEYEEAVWSLDFNHDGTILASTGQDGKILLWNVANKTFKTINKPRSSYDFINISFSPDGKLLAAAGQNHTVQLWNFDEKSLKILKGHEGDVRAVSFSRNGQLLASASGDTTVKLWKIDTGECLHTFEEHSESVNSVGFSPDGKLLASASDDGTIRLWNIDDKSLFKTIEAHDRHVNSVSFSHDGQRLISASGDSTVKLWNLKGEELYSFKGHKGVVRSANFSPNDRLIASASEDNSVKFWSVDGVKLNAVKGESSSLGWVSFSADSKRLASVSGDQKIELWELVKKTEIIKRWERDNLTIRLSLNNNGSTIALSNLQDISMLDTRLLESQNNPEIRNFKTHQEDIWDLSFSQNGRLLASASSDFTIKVWNFDNYLPQTFEHDRSVHSVSFSPNNELLAFGDEEGNVELWNINTDENRFLMFHKPTINAISFSPDGKLLASASDNSNVQLWKFGEDKPIILKGHTESVRSVSFSSDSQLLASGSEDRTVKLWSRDNNTAIQTFRGHQDELLGVSFSSDGKTLISVSKDNTIIKWNLDLDDLVMQGCSWLQDYLKLKERESIDNDKICDNID